MQPIPKLDHPRPRRHPQRVPRRPHQVARRMGADARRAGGDRAAQPCRLARGGGHQPVGHRPRPVRHGLAQRDARAHDAQRWQRLGGRIDAVFFCPHAPEDDCDCRKPLPGCCRRSAGATASTCAQVPMVGDTLRDLQAGAGGRLRAAPGAHRPRGARSTPRQLPRLRRAGARHAQCTPTSRPSPTHPAAARARADAADVRTAGGARRCMTRLVCGAALGAVRAVDGWSPWCRGRWPWCWPRSSCSGTPLYWMCVGWLRLAIWGARVICGVRHRVQGMEHLPTADAGPARCCWRPSTSPPGRPSPSRR